MASISAIRTTSSRGLLKLATWQNGNLTSLLSTPHPATAGLCFLAVYQNQSPIHSISHCNLENFVETSFPPNFSNKILLSSYPPSRFQFADKSTDFQIPFAYQGFATSVNDPKTPTTSVAAELVESEKEQKKQTLLQKGKDIEESDYWGIVPKKYKREDGSDWPWHSFRPADAYASNLDVDLKKHYKPKSWGDLFAMYLVKSMRIPTDIFFQKRYGCRAMMLETVAAVPGMVAGMLLHLQSLRRFQHTGGWIRALLDEAENERMHLMTFMEVSKPAWYERMLVLTVQGVFFNVYFLVYIINPRVAHRVVGYLEEEAVHSYTEFLKEIDAGRIENVPAPAIAIDYWRLPKDARLRDVVMVVRADEAHHRDVNHFASNVITAGKELKDNPAPMDYH